MDERALKYFEVVAKTQSIRAASEILHVSPSAISRKIVQLESQLDVRLMDRVGRGIQITESGIYLAKYIKDVNKRRNVLISQISELEHLQTGTLRISVGGGFIPDLINTVIAQFSQKHPGVKLVLQIGGGDDVIDSIKNEQADIGLLLNSKPDPKVDILYSCPFQELSLLVPNASSWAALDKCTPEQLADIPLALLNDSFSIRRAVDLYEVRQHIRLKTSLECNSFEALKSFVEVGLGGTLLPKVCVTKELRAGLFTAVAVEGMHALDTSIDLVMRKGRVQSASTREIQSCIINSMDAFNV
ncbi:LysR family transcriptional regulator [Vibrio sp. TH_r3]|uniref:LysR family transcriptional regulator n=1 Tax=Vibrio sp. TH_r3 TaxID=3082084 RepID=UPI002954D9E2|nr:LysR family transcriptional regulator [Vibrio sp. TH_r3]MDV7103338.1 LysR family transcriptional regulator [Vibrio sp. TH_r3]